MIRFTPAALLLCFTTSLYSAPPVEQQPTDPKAIKIVLIAGSSYYKPGEHEYIGTCAALMDLLKQSPNVAPVLAIDWPTKPETFAGAKAVVFFLDGGSKHPVLKGKHLEQMQALVDAGVGIVQLHQIPDYPKDLGDRARSWAGGAWEKGHSARAHWIAKFDKFPEHPIFRGVTPFTINDGFLTKIRFVDDLKGVTPLLSTVSPKASNATPTNDDMVAWAYDRAEGGRTVSFTGGHLLASLAEPGYRRFLVNSILWTAKVEIPGTGAPVELKVEDLPKYRVSPPVKYGKK